jgi:hypothetical protein
VSAILSVRKSPCYKGRMTVECISPAALSDAELLDEVKRLASQARRATAALVRALMEIDARKLYLRQGCASLFAYCTQVLHLAEGSAYNRIEVARAAQRLPVVLDALEDGSLTLTTIRLLAPHLTVANHVDVLRSAHHKSKREVEQLVAALSPKADVPSRIRRLPQASPSRVDSATPVRSPIESSTGLASVTSMTAPSKAREARDRSVIAPLAPSRFRLQVTLDAETHDKLRRAQDLLRHRIPDGDPAAVIDRALSLLLKDLEQHRCGAAARPRAAREAHAGSRWIPAAVKRAVWRRDEGRCAFVGAAGRCTERAFLEFHHVQPFAAGGVTTTDNIQLRCRAHNAYEAAVFFSCDAPDAVRERGSEW